MTPQNERNSKKNDYRKWNGKEKCKSKLISLGMFNLRILSTLAKLFCVEFL